MRTWLPCSELGAQYAQNRFDRSFIAVYWQLDDLSIVTPHAMIADQTHRFDAITQTENTIAIHPSDRHLTILDISITPDGTPLHLRVMTKILVVASGHLAPNCATQQPGRRCAQFSRHIDTFELREDSVQYNQTSRDTRYR